MLLLLLLLCSFASINTIASSPSAILPEQQPSLEPGSAQSIHAHQETEKGNDLLLSNRPLSSFVPSEASRDGSLLETFSHNGVETHSSIVPIYRLSLPLPPPDPSAPQLTNAQMLAAPGMPINPSMPVFTYNTVTSTREVQTPAGAYARSQVVFSLQKKQSSEYGAVRKLVIAAQKMMAMVGEIQLLESQYTTNPAAALANIAAKERIVSLCEQIPQAASELEAARGEVSSTAGSTKEEFQSYAQSSAE